MSLFFFLRRTRKKADSSSSSSTSSTSTHLLHLQLSGLPRHRLPHGRRRRRQAPPAHHGGIRAGPGQGGRAPLGAQPQARGPVRCRVRRAWPPRAGPRALRGGIAREAAGPRGRVRPLTGAPGGGDHGTGALGAELLALAGEIREREERKRERRQRQKKSSPLSSFLLSFFQQKKRESSTATSKRPTC